MSRLKPPPRNKPANTVVDFVKGLTHTKGEWAGQSFRLRRWQEDVLRRLFGTVQEDGRRRYRTCYLEVPRKNGKTEIAAALALYMLISDPEKGAEVYSAAVDREQASLVFSAAAQMVRHDAELSAMLEIVPSTRRMVHRASGSFYRAIPADAASAHGYNASAIIYDELHAAPNRELWDVLTTSMGARRQPLVIVITTAGYDRNSICWELHSYAENVLSGAITDPTFLPVIYAADPEADWLDEKVWAACNPALGDFRSLEEMRVMAAQAKVVPARQNVFRRLYLNQWCVTPNTMITMADGTRRRADELRPGDIILSFEESTRTLCRASVLQAKDNGTRDVFRVTTARGRSIEVTGNHRFWCRWGRPDGPKYGWVEAAALKPGKHRLAVALGHALPRGSRRMNAEEAYFLGAMVGDGTCAKSGIRFTNHSPGVLAAVREFVEGRGCRFVPLPDGHHWDVRALTRRPWGGGCHPQTPIRALLKKHGLNGSTCYDKRVPSRVYKGGARVWSAFLTGYLDTDGCVAQDADLGINWVSVNRSLLEDCQHLLALLGIQSAVADVSLKGYARYRLEVRDRRSLQKLAATLTPHHERKLELLAVHARRAMTQTGAPAHDRADFDRVTSVRCLASKPTIGLEIEGTHTHITNGLITHNTESETRWLDPEAWSFCGLEPIDPEAFRGRRAWLGLDLASTTDLTAAALVVCDDDGGYTVLPHFWMPAEHLAERQRRDRVPYEQWAREGFLELTDGTAVSHAAIYAYLTGLPERLGVDIAELAFDPWNATGLIQRIQETGLPCVAIPQTFKMLTSPTKELEKLVLERKLRHGNHPILRWCAANVVVEQDSAGNLKPSKAKSTQRIDGIVALVVALSRAILAPAEMSYEALIL